MFPTADAAGQQVSLITRVKVWFAEQPLLTKYASFRKCLGTSRQSTTLLRPVKCRSILVLCVGIYAVQVVGGYDNFGLVCLSARSVTKQLQVYRLLTSPFVHGGLLHIAFNMLAFVPIGCSLERTMGTLALAHLTGLLIFLGAGIYVGLATAAAAAALRYTVQLAYQCAIGFSGVIFGLIVVDNNISGAIQRSIFGFFYVPAPLYPWVLMLLWQVIMPGVSFLGHLCGVLAGVQHAVGTIAYGHMVIPRCSRCGGSSRCTAVHHTATAYLCTLGWAAICVGPAILDYPLKLHTAELGVCSKSGMALYTAHVHCQHWRGNRRLAYPLTTLFGSKCRPQITQKNTNEQGRRMFTNVLAVFQQLRGWLSHRAGWLRLPTDEPPTRPLSDPLIPSASHTSQDSSPAQSTGDAHSSTSPRTAAAAAAQARQAKFEAAQRRSFSGS